MTDTPSRSSFLITEWVYSGSTSPTEKSITSSSESEPFASPTGLLPPDLPEPSSAGANSKISSSSSVRTSTFATLLIFLPGSFTVPAPAPELIPLPAPEPTLIPELPPVPTPLPATGPMPAPPVPVPFLSPVPVPLAAAPPAFFFLYSILSFGRNFPRVYCSSFRSIGLEMYPSNPAAIYISLAPTTALAVRAMTGGSARPVSFNFAMVSKPSIFGIIWSKNTMS